MSRRKCDILKLTKRADDKRSAHATRRPPLGHNGMIPPAGPHRHGAECLEAQRSAERIAQDADCGPPWHTSPARGLPAFGSGKRRTFPSRTRPDARRRAVSFGTKRDDTRRLRREPGKPSQDAVCEPQSAASTKRVIRYRRQQPPRKSPVRGSQRHERKRRRTAHNLRR